MSAMRKILSTAAVAALLGVGALAATAQSASAYVACNAEGDCWHTDHRVRVTPNVRVEYHPDNWYFHRDWDHDKDHHWRGHHEGRGYYHGGVWIGL
jgi:arylamine N-acetyltransferase